MNVFFEFHRIVRELQVTNTPYALIGGVAMAYYAKAIYALLDQHDVQHLRSAHP